MLRQAKFPAMLIATLLVGMSASSPAQDAGGSKTPSSEQSQFPAQSFKLDYTLTETQAGKKIDSRQYTVNLGSGGSNGRLWQGELQIGTRVPVGAKADGTAQYLDVGTRITSSIQVRDGGEVLDTNCDVTSLAPDEAKVDGRPILRTLSIRNAIPVVHGKPILLGIADDPSSNREFQLEVAVTNLK